MSDRATANVELGQDVLTGSMLARAREGARIAHANNERFNMRSLRTNTFLIEEEWQMLDAAILQETEERLNIVEDIRAAGLTVPVDGLGVIETQYQRFTGLTAAEQNMTGHAKAEYDIPDSDLITVPIPITHKNFRLEWRFTESSRRRGQGIDVTTGIMAARMVAESLENMVVNGSTVVHAGNPIYGLINHPNRATYTISTDWDAVTANTDIITDVIGMRTELISNGFYGPYMLYIASNYEAVMDEDYKAESDLTVANRIRQIRGISDVKVVDAFPADAVVLIQMTRDVVDLVVAQELTTLDWDTDGGMMQHFKVMTGIVPRVKATIGLNCGVCHAA